MSAVTSIAVRPLSSTAGPAPAACPFRAIVPISAKNGEGLEELLAVLREFLPDGPALFPEDMVTDQPERVIVAEMIREKALRNLRDEPANWVPYAVPLLAMTTVEAKQGVYRPSIPVGVARSC